MKIVKQALESEGHRGKNGRAILRGIEFRWPNGQVPDRIEKAFQPEDRAQIIAVSIKCLNNHSYNDRIL